MATQKPNVLLLLHKLSLTGAPKVALDVFERLINRVNVRIVSLDGGAFEARCRELGPVQILNEPEGPLPWAVTSRKMKKVTQGAVLGLWKPDLIYVNSVAALPLAKWLRLPTAPVLLHVHELDTVVAGCLRGDLNLLTEWPDRYIAVSSAVSHMLQERYDIPDERVSLVHACVPDGNPFRPQRDASRDAECFVVGGAGEPGWRKGTTLWLQTAAAMKEIMAPGSFRFVWVGVRDDQHGVFFCEEARKLNVDSLVEFVPVTTEPLKHFAAFDAFAMTSWEDPCPIVVLENMMLETPVVCFAGGGGAAEEVAETGVVVEQFDPRAMALALAGLADDPSRRSFLGQAAGARVREHFTVSRQAPKIWAEMESLLAAG